jgi:FkbM family methyltransferase
MIRFIKWQIASKMIDGDIVVNWVNQSRLLIRRGRPGATLNLYGGLHEFEDMSFVLHALTSKDTFVDVGANIGSYTILASAVAGAFSFSIEPTPETYKILKDNIRINDVTNLVKTYNIAIGERNDYVRMTRNLDCRNHVVSGSMDEKGLDIIDIQQKTLDEVMKHAEPKIIKIDVEGYEHKVIKGAHSILSKSDALALILEISDILRKDSGCCNAFNREMAEYGFLPHHYDPFNRNLVKIENYGPSENTIYIKNADYFREKVIQAPKFMVNNVKI